ncbi:MAG: hypothetical protein BRC26_01090, partial [Nanohaloarchaea archaeon QH_8_44_6]
DLVLTTEEALADALNRRNNQDDVKTVFTPQQLAYNGESDFKRRVFLKIVQEADMTWRQTSYFLENILSCWKTTGDIDKIREYDGFDAENTEKVLNLIKAEENPLSAIEDFQVAEDKKVGVIQPGWFNELEKKLLPDKYGTINLFMDEEHQLPDFNIFNSAAEISSCLKQNIDRLGSENTAVVVDPESSYQQLIESVLASEDISFQTQKQFSADGDLRTMVSLLRAALSDRSVRIKDVRPIAQQMGIEIPLRDQNKYLEDIREPKKLKEFLNVVDYMKFGQFLEKYGMFVNRDLEIAKTVLEDLDLMDETVSMDAVNRIEYYLKDFELVESESEDGVLLVDPGKVSYIDRPAVFFVGIDSEWAREIGWRPWIDREHEESLATEKFKLLLQNGRKQVFMVQDKKMNQDVTPCPYLNELIDAEFTKFSELPHQNVRAKEQDRKDGFAHTRRDDIETDKIKAISQSDLNRFALSPRLYYFSKLVSDVEEEKMEKGNIFHDYAEFYVNCSEFVEDMGRERVVFFMLDHLKPYTDKMDKDELETELRVGVKNINA